MCGRFTLRTPMNLLVERFLFELDEAPLPARFNIAPSQPVAAVRVSVSGGARQLRLLRWGMIPSWARDKSIGYKLINARSETIDTKPSFRAAFKCRRCLILSDGYYEWQKEVTSTQKQPYYIRLQDDQPFAFAGLWETWQESDGSALDSCTIITTEANELTRPIHPRMPVILPPEDYAHWLDPQHADTAALKARLRPVRSELLTMYRVSTVVNNPRHETPDCIIPLDRQARQSSRPQQLDLL